MAKRKKRTKRYSGEDAKHLQASADAQPVVHRYQAVQRSRVGQWWHEKKRTVKIIAGTLAVATAVIWLLTELFRIVF